MNIFAFSDNPEQCARWLDNSRVGSALREANQMLSVAVLEHSSAATRDIGYDGLCKPTHVNHPVAVWVRECAGNFNWTLELSRALRDEYAHRYNGTIHGSANRLPIIESWAWAIPEGERTEFCNCAANQGLGLDFRHLPVHEAYKAYINARWALADHAPAWHKRSKPSWYEPRERTHPTWRKASDN